MFWRIFEHALSSALSRAMLELPMDRIAERIRRVGALPEEELERLISETRSRLEEVERDGREVRELVLRSVRSLLENLTHGRDGDSR